MPVLREKTYSNLFSPHTLLAAGFFSPFQADRPRCNSAFLPFSFIPSASIRVPFPLALRRFFRYTQSIPINSNKDTT